MYSYRSCAGPETEVIFSRSFLFLRQKKNRQNGAEIHVIHQEWEIHESHGSGPEGSPEERTKEEQKATNDGTSSCTEDERSKADHPGHGKIG